MNKKHAPDLISRLILLFSLCLLWGIKATHADMLLSDAVAPYDRQNLIYLYIIIFLLLCVTTYFIFLYLASKNKIAAASKGSSQEEDPEKLRVTLCSIGNGLIATDAEGNITFMNTAAEEITGFSSKESIGMPLRYIYRTINEETGLISEFALDHLLPHKKPKESSAQITLITKGGLKRTISNSLTHIRDDKNKFLGIVMVFQDITEKRMSEKKLVESEAKYRNLYEQAENAVILVNHDVFLDCNSKAAALFGRPREALLGTTLLRFVPASDGEFDMARLQEKLDATLCGTPQFFQWKFISASGEPFKAEVSIKPIDYNGKRMLQMTLFESNVPEVSEPLACAHAFRDSLTGLPNRKLFYDKLSYTLSQASAQFTDVAVFFIDLDLFKNINDTLGQDVGDTLLQQSAERLTECLPSNALIARMGGDEFGTLLPDIKEDSIRQFALLILKCFNLPFNINDNELFISVSIGISFYPEHGTDTHTLLKSAASAMYKAKELGRNNYQIYSPEMNEKKLQKYTMHKSLRLALERNEFVLHYQPKVDGRTGQLVGMEALIRWQHPEKGLIYPGDFIPLAEETGLIQPLGDWVLRAACRQLQEWLAAGHPSMRLAVNLSAWQFKEHNLAETVAAVLKETGIDPSLLELEITETAAMENLNFTIHTLGKLMDMGVNISIDDFGTGYSSLNYLKHFPINYLKIDRSFIADIIDDKNTYAIVKAIMEVAHTLNLKVIAEGVETGEQLAILRELGCDEIQGYFISKPLPVSEMEKRMVMAR